MQIEILETSYHIEVMNEEKEDIVVFLHGFTGSTKSWNETAFHFSDYRILLIDLLGHGKTRSSATSGPFSMERQIRELDQLFDKLELNNFVLTGYSMGGRIALAYACTYPSKVRALVLESASPGLKDEDERTVRQKNDSQLAEKILENGMTSFVDHWENIPLFLSQKTLAADVQRAVRQERLQQDPAGLAESLIGMGSGSQHSYWGSLGGLEMPVLLVTGKLDVKFEGIAEEMKAVLKNAKHKSVMAGHAIHVEKPAEFATIVGEYLKLNSLGGKS
ncbi:MAG TPA: 2-succinyl-6-hydroxy-2,4-cyclohexadiene-1-carboxylate synthase [Planococcus sp. (in: firmicutes)]|nr:2-succinyl-6-hydroxy-2,4-cyclohexadiene-1-carboxylate synthase [Planococcus sp. (in: firmicutes)]